MTHRDRWARGAPARARAEAAPSRTKREQPVVITGNPAEPLPEIHVAPDVPTVLLFPADIQKKTLTVDPSRIRVVDTGGRSIIVQAVENYRLRAIGGWIVEGVSSST